MHRQFSLTIMMKKGDIMKNICECILVDGTRIDELELCVVSVEGDV